MDFEVISLALPGVGTAHEFFLYKNEGIKYDPDIVIVQFFCNDLQDSIYNYNFDRKTKTLKGTKSNKPASLIQRMRICLNKIPFFDFICERSHLINFLRYRISMLLSSHRYRRVDHLLHQEKIDRTAYLEEVGIKYFDLLISSICEDNKILVILTADNWLKDFPTLYHHLTNQRKENLHLLDIDVHAEGDYIFDLHWDPGGHRIVAEAIFEYLTEKRLIK